jgi:hypothetical protein
MTDLQSRTEWHTTADTTADQLAAARAEITRLTDSLRWVERMRAQAEERVEAEKEATAAAELRVDFEANRADGAESKLHRVLVEYVVEPATGVVKGVSDGIDARDIPDEVIESTAETLAENLEVDPAVDKLAELARGLLTDWAERS